MIRWIAAPLDVEGWEITESLEDYALYPEYKARIDECLELITDGQAFWCKHRNAAADDSESNWQPEAEKVTSEVRRLAYNIRQSAERYGGDMAEHIRSSIGASCGDGISDAAYIAALGMDRACRAIETISRWLVGFDAELAADWGPRLKAVLVQRPDLYDERVNQTRDACAVGEGETREAVAELIGTARRYVGQAAHLRQVKAATAQRARKAGQASGQSRQEERASRDKAINDHGRRLLERGHSPRELAGIIQRTALAEREPGGDKLSTKAIRTILKNGGVRK